MREPGEGRQHGMWQVALQVHAVQPQVCQLLEEEGSATMKVEREGEDARSLTGVVCVCVCARRRQG